MLSFFRTNQILVSVFLLLYLLALQSAGLVEPNGTPTEPSGVLGFWALETLSGWFSPTVLQLLVILLVFMQAVMLIAITLNQRFHLSANLFAGLFFALAASMIEDFQSLSAPLLANFFFILALAENWRLYKKIHPADSIFNMGFWIGMASLFYFPALFLAFWAALTIPIMRSMEARHVVMLLVGILTPFLLTGVSFFWFDEWDWFMQKQFLDNISFFSFRFDLDAFGILKLTLLFLLMLISIMSFGLFTSKRDIATQKRISSLYWALFFVVLASFFQADTTITHFLLAAVPLGLFLSLHFSVMPLRLAESVHLLLVLGVLMLNYRHFLLGGGS